MSFRSSSMDTCSSGEELTVKARKPYTITKQRERWTEEEHNLFLEALKLYGRAWQRIEDHIGTKTAVQIRSHAQKFLTKLEKEALSKGISLKQAIDIEIPPPRPKRKPSNPYPRKICLGTISSSKGGNSESPSISISSDQSKILPLKNATSPENLAGSDCSERTKVVSEKGNCSETLRLFQDVPSHSFASEKRNSGSPQSFRKFVPSLKEIKKKPEFDKSGQTANENEEAIQCTDSTDNDIGLCLNLQTKVAPMKRHVQHKPEEEGSNCELQATKERERHLSVHSTDMNNENCIHSNPQIATSATTQSGSQVHPNPKVVDPSVMVTPENLIHSTASFHQELPTFPPFTLFHNNQDAYKSFFNMSSTFSNFILSTLLQNPAAHAAASLASSFWSSVGDTTNCASEVLNSGVPPKHTNMSLNMAVIASATVAAATAWWATHGLFPLCHPPLSNGFAIAVAPATSSANFTNRSPEERVVTKGDDSRCQAQQDEHVLDSESPEAPGLQRSTSKSMPLSSSDSESRGDKPHGSEGNGSKVKELLMPKIDPNECGDITRNGKKTSIYSCGSNKLSSNEKEIKTTLDENKLEIYKESKEPEKYSLLIEAKNRQFRNSGSMNESWKEVSEEGRIAFQALFSREVLPQSFSPPNVEETATNLNNDVIVARTPVDLSINVFADEVVDRVPSMKCETSKSIYHSILLCKNGLVKLRANHTGFQPYKRCSMEAENTTSVGDEKTSKRSRLEEEALTR